MLLSAMHGPESIVVQRERDWDEKDREIERKETDTDRGIQAKKREQETERGR